ncbi:helix-turn-helix transcriptional regulator [Sphingopyxis sp. H115]|uniref:helix-turn-helix transcriptional regulator n=1 Tax=Sphingopyxis sp. H115 TaxID=1759073 RepID=UPI001F43A266|nr:AlpA family phage regulatory protein [Sphingopyxis sp. H115]
MNSPASNLHRPKSTARGDAGGMGLAEELAKLISASPAALKLIAAAMKERQLDQFAVSTPCSSCDTKSKSLEVISTSAEADDPLVSLDVVKRIAGIGKTRIYALIRQHKFPKPYKPGGTASRWSLAEVKCWRDEQRLQ